MTSKKCPQPTHLARLLLSLLERNISIAVSKLQEKLRQMEKIQKVGSVAQPLFFNW